MTVTPDFAAPEPEPEFLEPDTLVYHSSWGWGKVQPPIAADYPTDKVRVRFAYGHPQGPDYVHSCERSELTLPASPTAVPVTVSLMQLAAGGRWHLNLEVPGVRQITKTHTTPDALVRWLTRWCQARGYNWHIVGGRFDVYRPARNAQTGQPYVAENPNIDPTPDEES